MVYLDHNFQVHYDPVVSVHPVHQVREDNCPERAVPLEPIILEWWMTMTPFWREYLHHHNEHQGAITAISLSSYDDNILATAGEVTVIIIHQCEQIGRNNIDLEKKKNHLSPN